ncbi:MAG: insulinase family protein, partial [Longimicrobiales bacterium]|nr:insulinase family protein [Longimicrobiales bacterium]
LVVLPNHEAALVTVDLFVPGGRAADPEGEEGLALLAASLLTSGTTSRSAAELADTLAALGASLDATADADRARVSLLALPDLLTPALDLMAEVVTRPAFPESGIERLRGEAFAALAVEAGRPASLARRVLFREVYRGHPYARQATRESFATIGRADLVAHHTRWYRPAAALIVVAGDVDAAEVERRLEAAFAQWGAAHEAGGGTAPQRGGAAFEPSRPAAALPRPDGGILLIHQPDLVETEVRIGHPLPRGDAEAWPSLLAAAHHLGATPSGVLDRRLRDELGYTGAVSAIARRRPGPGVIEVAFSSRTGVAADALGEALRILEEVRARPMEAAELQRVVEQMTGTFTLQSETPAQLAERVASDLLVGRALRDVARLPERLRSLTPRQVQRAFAAAVDPTRVEIVVIGDAGALQPRLATFGPVRIETPDGHPLSIADLAPARRSTSLSAEGLPTGRWEYAITLRGEEVGALTRRITHEGDVMTARSELSFADRTTLQSVSFGVDRFDFRSSTFEVEQPGVRAAGEASRSGRRLTGLLDLGRGPEPIDLSVPDDVLVADMVELAIWLADLEVGDEIRLPVANLATRSVSNARLRVTGRETITVQAGRFEVFRVEISGVDVQTVWARVEAPHLPIRVAPAGAPILVELVSASPSPTGGG